MDVCCFEEEFLGQCICYDQSHAMKVGRDQRASVPVPVTTPAALPECVVLRGACGASGFWGWGLGLRVGSRIWGLGFGVWGLGFGVRGLGVGVWGSGFGA